MEEDTRDKLGRISKSWLGSRKDIPSGRDSMSKVMGMRNSTPFLRKVQRGSI